jgi:hypothetical protein
LKFILHAVDISQQALELASTRRFPLIHDLTVNTFHAEYCAPGSTKVAKELGWSPVQELLEEIHEGDPQMGSGWPFNYSSLESLNKRRRDWRLRYAAAFQLNSFAESESQRTNTAV